MRRTTTLLVAGLSVGLIACQNGNGASERAEAAVPRADSAAATTGDTETSRDLVAGARQTLQTMQGNGGLWNVAQEAKGVFIVPDYGRAGAVVGGGGGEGVLFGRVNGSFGDPLFYTLGQVSVGAELGAEGGEIAMLLMTDGALESFTSENDFSLSAQAGLTVSDFSATAQESAGRGDVILWSDTEGAFAGASLGATDIHFDEDQTEQYYGRPVAPADMLGAADEG